MALKSSSACSVSKEVKCGSRDTRAKLSVSAICNKCSDSRKKIQRRKTYSVHNRRIANVEKYCVESSSDSEIEKRSLPFTKYIKQKLSGDDKKEKNQKKQNEKCKKLAVIFSKDENCQNEEWNKVIPELVQIMYPVRMPNIWHYLGYANAVKDDPIASTSGCQDEKCHNKTKVITNIKTAKSHNWFSSRDVVVDVEVEDQTFAMRRKVLVEHSLAFRRAFQSNDSTPLSVTLSHIPADDFTIVKSWMDGKKHVVNENNAIDIMVVAKKLEMPDLFLQCEMILRCPAGRDERTETKNEAKKRKKDELAKAKALIKEEKRNKKVAEKRRIERDSSDITVTAAKRISDLRISTLDDESDSPSTTEFSLSETTNELSSTAITETDCPIYPSRMTESLGFGTPGCGSIVGRRSKNTRTKKTKTKTKTAYYPTISELINPVKAKRVNNDKQSKEKNNEEVKFENDVGLFRKYKTDNQRSGTDRKIPSQIELQFDLGEDYCTRRRESATLFATRPVEADCDDCYDVSEAKRKLHGERLKKSVDDQLCSLNSCKKRIKCGISSLTGPPKMENQKADLNENDIPIGMLVLTNDEDAVLVDRAKALRESRRLKRLMHEAEQAAGTTSICIRKINRSDLKNLAAWMGGGSMTITPANVFAIKSLAERLEMPVLLQKTRWYQLDLDKGCRTPRKIFWEDWTMNQPVKNANAEIDLEQSETGNSSKIQNFPFQGNGYGDDSTKDKPEPAVNGCVEYAKSILRPEPSSSSCSATSTEESSRKTTPEIDDCDINNNNNNNLIMDTICHLFGWNQKKENQCERESCKTTNKKPTNQELFLKSMQLLVCQENIVLGESYCGGNELNQTDFNGSVSILKFPFDACKFHWVISEPSIYHAFCAAAVFKGKLYVSGGRNIRPPKNITSVAVGDIWCFDRSYDKWCHVGSMCVNRIHHCAIVYEDSIYFVGGLGPNLRPLSSVERMQISNESVSICEVSPVSVARAGASGTAHGNMIFVAGGISNHPTGSCGCHILDEMECYNSSSNKWHRLEPLAIPRAFATVISSNQVLYVIGGVTFKDKIESALEAVCSIADVEIYGGLRITPTSSLVMPRYAASATVHNNHLYVFGGIELETGSHVPLVERFSTTKQNWVLANDDFSSQLQQLES